MNSHESGGFDFKFLERLKQRNLFRVTAAYLGVAWFVVHVATVIGETFKPVHHALPRLIYALAAGLPLVLVGSWLSHRAHGAPLLRHLSTRKLDGLILAIMALAVLALLADRWLLHRTSDESMFVLLALMIAVLLVDRLIGWRTATRLAPTITAKGSEPRVAILPFADMSPEKNQDYFCEGAAEEIINALCAVNGLRVASRSASFQLKNRALDAREVGDCFTSNRSWKAACARPATACASRRS